MASEPPRRMQALPLLMASDAASIVTLGRLSKIMPNTPSGTRMWPTLMPLGRRLRPVISPTGSGMAAICSQPCATVSMMLGVSFKRSTRGAAKPACMAWLMSMALAVCKAAQFSRRSTAKRRSAASLAAVLAAAIRVDAVRAAAPTSAMYAAMSACLSFAVMGPIVPNRVGLQPNQAKTPSHSAAVTVKARVEMTVAAVASASSVS